MAGMQHGMCELTRHGMAGERHTNGKGAAWHVQISFNEAPSPQTISIYGDDEEDKPIRYYRKQPPLLKFTKAHSHTYIHTYIHTSEEVVLITLSLYLSLIMHCQIFKVSRSRLTAE
jgi:hypothetical protein